MFSEEVVKIVRDASRKYPSDIKTAAEQALREIQKLGDFKGMVDLFMFYAVRCLVHEARCRVNQDIKDSCRVTAATATVDGYRGRAKVDRLQSQTLEMVYESTYNYCIGRTTLGEVLGADLPGLRSSEEAKASGHQFNSALLRWLESKKIPAVARVRDVVPEPQLRGAFERLQREMGRVSKASD